MKICLNLKNMFLNLQKNKKPNEIKLVKKGELTKEMLMNIVNAPIITNVEFDELLEKQNSNNLTCDDRHKIDKYYHCLKFKINPNELNTDTLKIIYGKYQIIDNHKSIINFDPNNKSEQSEQFDKNLNFKKSSKIIKFIEILGFKFINMKIEDKSISKQELITHKR